MLASSTQFVLSLDPALDSIYHSLHDVRPGISSLQRVLCSLVFTCAVCVNECLSVPLILTKEKYLPKVSAYPLHWSSSVYALILFLLWVLKLLLWFYFPDTYNPKFECSKLSIQKHCLRTISPFMSSLDSLPAFLFLVLNIYSCTQCKLRPSMTNSVPPTQNLVMGFRLWSLSFSYLQLMEGKKMPLSTII